MKVPTHLNALLTLVLATASGLVWGEDTLREDRVGLNSGGFVRGRMATRPASSRDHVDVETAWGGHVQLPMSEVARVTSPDRIREYDRVTQDLEETPDGHWRMDQWCRQNEIDAEYVMQLHRILELDPQHSKARSALGYRYKAGRWILREDYLKQRGYRRYGGKWILAAELDLLKAIEHERQEMAAVEEAISQRLGDYRRSGKPEVLDRLKTFADPRAVDVIGALVWRESDPAVLHALLELLGNLRTNDSIRQLLDVYFNSVSDEYRHLALQQLQRGDKDAGRKSLIRALRHTDNRVVNLAADALAKLGGHESIGPLVDALYTSHDIMDQPTLSTAPSASRLQWYDDMIAESKSIGLDRADQRLVENHRVLAALVQLTDGANFGFDVHAWLRWHVGWNQTSPPTDNLRRGL